MNKFKPERLTVEYRNGVTVKGPITPRNHTLTHSDFTGELFLTIGTEFAWDTINKELRDDVMGQWQDSGNYLYYCVYLVVDKQEHDFITAVRRNEIFRRELPLALTAIRYGDRHFLKLYPALDNSLIMVNFMSAYPQLSKLENWGTFSNYGI